MLWARLIAIQPNLDLARPDRLPQPARGEQREQGNTCQDCVVTCLWDRRVCGAVYDDVIQIYRVTSNVRRAAANCIVVSPPVATRSRKLSNSQVTGVSDCYAVRRD